ncbi:MAG: alpha/beta hydrolase [Richelia sp. RM2_1_2]|nr:alpha/beta hydrolase [Richelia sp. RM1_1_1]NJO59605.1 alpha/beta hydrolase [Richelia sp. RM2_1_2]
MKIKTILTCVTLTVLSVLMTVVTPVMAQQPPDIDIPGATSIVTEEDNQILARVTSQEGIPTSPELKSVLNQTVELKDFGNIAFRSPLKSSSKKATPVVLFHGIFGGVSHRQFRQLRTSLDQAGVPVYIMDLPGVGRSAKPKTTYNLEKIDQFISEFLREVVGRPANVVTTDTTTLSGLKVAAQNPDLVKSLVIISPFGINNLASPPTENQNQGYQQTLETDDAAIWVNLLLPDNIRPFNQAGFSQPSFLEKNGDILIEEALIERPNIEQRWISYAFIFGQFFRTFAEASKDVKVPVLAIFGADYKPIPGNPPMETDRAEQFRQIRPDFKYLEIPQASTLVATEQPDVVAKAIMEFSCGRNCFE